MQSGIGGLKKRFPGSGNCRFDQRRSRRAVEERKAHSLADARGLVAASHYEQAIVLLKNYSGASGDDEAA
jgi:hypothetical protein